jgi:hypothetical protein
MGDGLTEVKDEQRMGDGSLRVDFEIELLQNHPNLTIEPKTEPIKWF